MKFKRQPLEEVSLNITPLIDVVFLLLIFFMVTTTFTKENQLTIDLPTAKGEPAPKVKELELMINKEGAFFVNGQGLMSNNLESLTHALARVARGHSDIPLIIAADGKTPHQAVVTAMQAAGDAGINHFSITTQQPE